jgi:DNA gyrase/topoisomerase IV subunit A
MNVLARGRVPMVLSLRGVLRQWLDHRKEVLGRRTRHRLAEIARRIEVLGGLLIAYLNLDEVIRIIREDEPKPALMRASRSPTCRPRRSSTCACGRCAGWRRSRSGASTTRSSSSRAR